MQLKLSRSQRPSAFTKTVIFCLDARADLTPEEEANVNRYKMASQVIYNSEAAKRQLAKGEAAADGSFTGSMIQLGRVALARLNLNVTIDSLQRGHHIECKDLEELLATEDALMIACRNLKAYLDTAATFDGREILFDFGTGEPVVSAQSGSPRPQLAAPPTVAPTTALHREAAAPEGPTLQAAGAAAEASFDDWTAPHIASPGFEIGLATYVDRWNAASIDKKVLAGLIALIGLYILTHIL